VHHSSAHFMHVLAVTYYTIQYGWLAACPTCPPNTPSPQKVSLHTFTQPTELVRCMAQFLNTIPFKDATKAPWVALKNL
jgi:hypothetical protein